MKTKKVVPGRAWAWMIQDYSGARWELCSWARPTRDALERTLRPSPEARAVRVMIVRPAPKRRKARKAKRS